MRVFKTKEFHKWALREGLSNPALVNAIEETGRGLIDGDLGGHVIKKRIALAGIGKRGGVRTLLAFRTADKGFFVYGFAKNARANVNRAELKALKRLSSELFSYDEHALAHAIKQCELVEIKSDE